MLPQPLFHLVKEFIGKTEPYVDAFFLEKIAHEVNFTLLSFFFVQ